MLYNKYEISVKDFLNEIEDMNSFGSKWLNIPVVRIKQWVDTDIPFLDDINNIKGNMNLLLDNKININYSDEKYDKSFIDTIRNKILEYFNKIGRFERKITNNFILGKDEYIL